MRSYFAIIIFSICFSACNSEKNEESPVEKTEIRSHIFDKEKWRIKEGKDYPYRDQMLHDVVYNDTIRTLNKDQLYQLLGEPDYVREDHLYYRTKETRLVTWTLHTRSMVIKMKDDDTIEWIKIHE